MRQGTVLNVSHKLSLLLKGQPLSPMVVYSDNTSGIITGYTVAPGLQFTTREVSDGIEPSAQPGAFRINRTGALEFVHNRLANDCQVIFVGINLP